MLGERGWFDDIQIDRQIDYHYATTRDQCVWQERSCQLTHWTLKYIHHIMCIVAVKPQQEKKMCGCDNIVQQGNRDGPAWDNKEKGGCNIVGRGGKARGNQKLASRVNVWSGLSTPTPDLEYSPTCFSKKFVFPWRLIVPIHSNRLLVLQYLLQSRSSSSKSAQNLIFAHHG